MLLPLDTFREAISYQPWHFWGWANATIPVNSRCNTIVTEYAWQNADALGRSDIRRGIDHAESRLREQLGYSIAPRFTEDMVSYPRSTDNREWFASQDDGSGQWRSVFVPEKWVQAVGIEGHTLIGTPAVVYSDLDGDGLNETFTLSIATTVTDPHEIAIYFNAVDRFNGEGPGDRWRIEPVRVSISGGVVTITGNNSWILARPVLYESAAFTVNTPLDPDVSANFAQTLDVYRRFCDPSGITNATSQVLFEWETPPYTGWGIGCCGNGTYNANSTDPAALAYAMGRAGIRNKEIGAIAPGTALYDATTGAWVSVNWWTCSLPPQRLTVRYRAGWRLDKDGQVAREWQVPVTRMAIAEMTRRLCACDVANREWATWAFDVSRAAGANDEQYTVSREDLTNPFGTRRGHIDAWRKVRTKRVLRGIPM